MVERKQKISLILGNRVSAGARTPKKRQNGFVVSNVENFACPQNAQTPF